MQSLMSDCCWPADIDDKIIARAREQQVDPSELTARYITVLLDLSLPDHLCCPQVVPVQLHAQAACALVALSAVI